MKLSEESNHCLVGAGSASLAMDLKLKPSERASLDTALLKKPTSKLTLSLVGIESTSATILSYFRDAAERAGWNDDKASTIIHDATTPPYGADPYNHLLRTILSYCL